MSRRSLTWLAAPLGALACAAPAQAAYGPFTLIDGSPALRLQADKAFDAAISADGSSVAWTGSIASRAGIYLTTLATGQAQVVALGSGTGAPSISAEGRYISFTTSDDLETGLPVVGGCSSVYVRDMNKHVEEKEGKLVAEAGAYTLVSARDGSAEGLTYAPPKVSSQACGAASAYRAAISGDGREVAFTVLSESDLTGNSVQTKTPPGQVAVRDLDTQRTMLVSLTRASREGGGKQEPVPGGAAIAPPEAIAFEKVPTSASTAAISADGKTVAWMGINVQEQTDIATPPPNGGIADGYAEPLWRRFAEGSRAPTRRILAGDDASAPQCPPSCPGGLDLLWQQDLELNQATGPVFGSYLAAQGFAAAGGTNTDPLDVVTPQLSANGLTVALLSTQPTYGDDPQYGNGSVPPLTANAFVVNMTPGLGRAQAITRLTEWASLNLRDVALAGGIAEIAVSPDGTRVAFVTQRVVFPLAPPALITPPPSQAASEQLYVVNLAAGTLQFVSEGYEGQPANSGILDVALDSDGGTLALASSASNLAFGTGGNSGIPNVFVAHEIGSPPGPGQQSVSPLPGLFIPSPRWSLSATTRRSTGGDLLIDVSVPGAGSLAASASASVPTTAATAGPAGRGAAHSHAHRSSTARSGDAGAARARKVTAIATRKVAHAFTTTNSAELVQLRLAPASRYRTLAYGKDGLYVTITVTFTARGHPRLTDTLNTSFQARSVHKSSKPLTRKSGKRPPMRGR
jgi:WD40-like Beta Propeller Repeat